MTSATKRARPTGDIPHWLFWAGLIGLIFLHGYFQAMDRRRERQEAREFGRCEVVVMLARVIAPDPDQRDFVEGCAKIVKDRAR